MPLLAYTSGYKIYGYSGRAWAGIRGKKGSCGITIKKKKTGQAMVFGIYEELVTPGQHVDSTAVEVASGRSWLKDYVDRLSSTASLSISSRALSLRSSGRFFTGSSRRDETVSVGDWDLKAKGRRISSSPVRMPLPVSAPSLKLTLKPLSRKRRLHAMR